MRALQVTADDFGLCAEVNRAVCRLHDRGVVHRTSLLVNTEHFADSIALLRARPGLHAGLHLNLTDGAPVLPAGEIPTLVNGAGRFVGGRHYAVLARILTRPAARREVRAEWRAQIAKALDAGLEIRHLNAHGHLHLLPVLHGVVAGLIAEFEIPAVRVALQMDSLRGAVFKPCSLGLLRALRRRGVAVSHPDRLLGLGSQGGLTRDAIVSELARRGEGLAELVTHPSDGPNPYHRAWEYDGDREMRSLLSPDIEPLLKQ